jgi:ABC-2 type transport system permease protein
MMLFLFGSIYGNQPQAMFNGYGSVDVSVPAYTAMIIATTGIMGINITMASYREKGILRRLRISPLHPSLILAGQLVVVMLMTVAGMGLLVLAGRLVYQMRFEGSLLAVIPAFLLGSLSFFSLGFVLASLMPNARTAQVVGMAVLYPMLFLSGAGMPLEILPESLRNFSKFLPLTHVVTLLRGLWFGGSWSQHTTELWVLLGVLVLGVVISSLAFRWE